MDVAAEKLPLTHSKAITGMDALSTMAYAVGRSKLVGTCEAFCVCVVYIKAECPQACVDEILELFRPRGGARQLVTHLHEFLCV